MDDIIYCKHCGREIVETSDPNVPYVHAFGGNRFCDVFSVADAVERRGKFIRTVAEPGECDTNLTDYPFSTN